MSGRSPDCIGPFLLPPVEAERSGLRAAEVLVSGLGESGLHCDDTSGSPAPWGGEAGGVSPSIISGRRSPEDELCREELLAGLQRMDPRYCSRSRKLVLDVGGQISDLPKLRNVLLCDRGGHPPALKVGSGHD